jgi:glycerophosphoryl diester phosphodiesterase
VAWRLTRGRAALLTPPQPILMHDSTLSRTTNCTGTVTNVNYYGFVEYCVAGGVERVPTVRAMLDYLASSSVMEAYFDIKCSGACIDALGALLRGYPFDFTGRLYLGGQTQADVARLAEQAPGYRRSIVMSSLPRDPASVDVQNFNINFSAVQADPSFVARANANNQTVFAWTINSESGMRAALAIPVNGVVTDYPDVFLALRDGQRTA